MRGFQPAEVRVVDVAEGVRMAVLRASGSRLALPVPIPGAVMVGGCFRGMCTVSHLGVLDVVGAGDSFLLLERSEGAGELTPLGDFQGYILLVGPDPLPEATRRTLEGFDVDLGKVRACLARGGGFAWLTGSPMVGHVTSEMAAGLLRGSGEGLFRLKAIELLQAISREAGEPAAAAEPKAATRLTHEALAYAAQRAMMEDLEHPKTIEAIARACGTSPTVLKQSFRETFGMPVYQWYRSYRVQRAAESLASNDRRSISEVALEVGYANPSKFTSAFRSVMGVSPSEWRARERADR